jgi:hypothetical protein
LKKSVLAIGLYAILILVLLVGCQPNGTAPKPNSTEGSQPPAGSPSATAIPTMGKGKGAVAGWIIQKSDGKPYGNGGLNLALVYRSTQTPSDGAFVLDSANSPGAITKMDGTFLVNNVDSGEYVVVVGNPEGTNEVYLDPTSGKPKVWKVDAGKVLNIGEIKTNLAPQP